MLYELMALAANAPQTGDVVKVSSINSAYYTRQYAGATRVY